MRPIISAILCAATLLAGLASAQGAPGRSVPRLPLAFVENRGQLDEAARFSVHCGGLTTFVTLNGFVAQAAVREVGTDAVHGASVFFTFEAASADAKAKVGRPLAGRMSFIHGDDPARWVTDVPTFADVAIEDICPGCALRFHGDRGAIEYDLHLAAGRDPRAIAIACDGAESLSIDPSGALVVRTAIGDLRQEAPTTWRVAAGGSRTQVPSRFRLIDARRFGFEVDDVDPSQELVIDPSLAFAGYLGGSGADECNAVALDASGAIYLAGRTGSANFPKTAGAFDATLNGTFEGFVTKINAAGTALVYSTYIGAPGSDDIQAIVVNAAGQVTLTGYSGTGFPVTTGAYDTSYAGWKEGTVARLNATGTGVVFATYVGGSHEDIGNGIALDAAGNIYVVGQTQSPNFPTTSGAFDQTPNGGWDAFFVKLSPTGSSMIFGTVMGGSGIDWAYDVAITSGDQPVICGGTSSTTFPTTPGSADPTPNGSMDAFVAKFNATATSLVWSTVLGSPGSDQALDLAVDGSGCPYVTGVALPGFPTTPGACDITNDNGDAFVVKLSANGASLVYATFIGGSGTEQGSAIAVDASGAAYVAGFTNSTNLATTPSGYQHVFGGGGGAGDALVAKLNPGGTALDYCSYFGGVGYEDARGIAIDGVGGVCIAGAGVSPNLPVSAGPFAAPMGIDDAFFAKFMLTGLATVNDLAAGCAPAGAAPSAGSTNPVLGTTAFVWGVGAPGNAPCNVFVSTPIAPATLPTGCVVCVDPLALIPVGICTTTAAGDWLVAVSVPPLAQLVGLTVNLQAVIWDPAGPWGFELSGSVGLTLGY